MLDMNVSNNFIPGLNTFSNNFSNTVSNKPVKLPFSLQHVDPNLSLTSIEDQQNDWLSEFNKDLFNPNKLWTKQQPPSLIDEEELRKKFSFDGFNFNKGVKPDEGNWEELQKEALKQKFAVAGANLVGSAANMATDALSKDMVFSEGTQKFSNVARIAEDIPVFGNAIKVIRMGANAAAKAMSTDIDTIDYDPELAARMGASYGFSKYDKLKETNDKQSVFWKTDDHNKNKNLAKQELSTISNIDKNAQASFAMANNFGQNQLNYNNKLNGGNNILRIGKKGLSCDLIKRAKRIKPKKKVNEFKEGGVIFPEIIDIRPIILEDEPVIKFQKGGKTTRSLEELIAYAKEQNPRFVQRLSEPPRGIKFTDDEGNEGEGSHYLEWATDDRSAIIYPRIQEMEDGSLKFLSAKEAWERANKNNNVLIMSPEEAEIFFAEDPEYRTAYKRGWPQFFEVFKQGGNIKESELVKLEETTQKNVIPEGALHKNKHHIEHTDGLTQKGIPVIDNDGDQQAEIELDEIIFTLEVTKKLEELHKIFKEGSNKEKDEAAIEAGKLLVQEILYNTDDRTGLISKCQKGGKLNELE